MEFRIFKAQNTALRVAQTIKRVFAPAPPDLAAAVRASRRPTPEDARKTHLAEELSARRSEVK